MPAALSMRQRREIIEQRERGVGCSQIADELGVACNTVNNIYQRYKQKGQLAPAYERCRHTAIRKSKANRYEPPLILRAKISCQ